MRYGSTAYLHDDIAVKCIFSLPFPVSSLLHSVYTGLNAVGIKCFLFIEQMGMGTHTLSGTREYGKFYSRDETTYKNDHFPRYCPVKDLHTIIIYYCWACCTASYHQFAVLHRSRQVACDVMTHPPTQRF